VSTQNKHAINLSHRHLSRESLVHWYPLVHSARLLAGSGDKRKRATVTNSPSKLSHRSLLVWIMRWQTAIGTEMRYIEGPIGNVVDNRMKMFDMESRVHQLMDAFR
jgi:hypothetical protein